MSFAAANASTAVITQRTIEVNITNTSFTTRKIQAVVHVDAPVKVSHSVTPVVSEGFSGAGAMSTNRCCMHSRRG